MTGKIKGFLNKLGPLSPTKTENPKFRANGFIKPAQSDELFSKTDPSVDGEECLHDCSTCTIKYPSKFSIDESDILYGEIKGWNTHLLVATGKTDWVRDVADEKGSVMEAVEKSKFKLTNGRMMLSASNMPLSYCSLPNVKEEPEDLPTTVLLLPAWKLIDNVTPAATTDLLKQIVDGAPTNMTPLQTPEAAPAPEMASLSLVKTSSSQHSAVHPSGILPAFEIRDCPHKYLVLLCSQKTRDARCGQSAPLLRKELERHLRPLGLYRDLDDERPDGCGIYFISHVGGHKYSANVMIYRRADADGMQRPDERSSESSAKATDLQAAQCIWLARIRPEHCENLVRYTILQGKVVDPAKQLRGGFDRSRQMISW